MINYWRISIKAVFTGIFALFTTLLITMIAIRILGGKLGGTGLVMTIVCPLVTAIPFSAFQFLKNEKLRIANEALTYTRNALNSANAKLLKQSQTDYLTNVLNRETFFHKLQILSEGGSAGALLFIDFDYFKKINDTYGHATGDAALRRVGRLMAELTPENAIVGRIGGEEFGIFVPNLSLERVDEYAETVRKRISELIVRASNKERIKLSVSIGIALCNSGFKYDKALMEADEKMYQAKDRGRNLIVS